MPFRGRTCVVLLLAVCALSASSSTVGGAGETELVTLALGGVESVQSPAISDDGRFLAFVAHSDALVPGDSNAVSDIVVSDRQSGALALVSVGPGNRPADGASSAPSISADGRYVAFVSEARNLDGSAAAGPHIYVRDRVLGRTRLVAAGEQPVISGDGSAIAYVSPAASFSAAVYVRDLDGTDVELISTTVDGRTAQGYQPAISGDGRRVAFLSADGGLVADDPNRYPDVFVRDRLAGTTIRVNVSSGGRQDNGYVREMSLSRDGQHVAFASSGTNLVADDRNGWTDVFVHDIPTRVTSRVSVPTGGGEAARESYRPLISADGRYVAFVSTADNLDVTSNVFSGGVFVHDRATRVTERVDIPPTWPTTYPFVTLSAFDATGRFVLFQTPGALTAEDMDGDWDLYIRDRAPHSMVAAIEALQSAAGRAGVPPAAGMEALFGARANAVGGDRAGACSSIDDFVTDVQQRRGADLPADAAASLFSDAEFVRLGLGCGPRQPQTFRFVRSSMPLPSWSFAWLAQLGDVNGDALPDAVMQFAGRRSGWYALLGDGSGSFPRTVPLGVAAGPAGPAGDIQLADLNADGRQDFVLLHGTPARVSIALAGPELAPPAAVATELVLPSGYNRIKVADATGDGAVDVLAINPEDPYLRLFAGRGDGTFAAAALTWIGPDPSTLDVVRTKEGAYADVIIGRSSSLAIVPGAAGRFLEGFRPVLEGSFSSFTTADLNGDGRLDVLAPVAQYYAHARVEVYLSVTDGFVHSASLLSPDGAQITVGDYDADGMQDLVLAGWSAQSLLVHHGNGDGTFGIRETVVAGRISSTMTADVNRDGTEDLVAVRVTSGDGNEPPPASVLSVFLNKPLIVVQTQNSAEHLALGTTRAIRWQHALPASTRFRVDVSADGGRTWRTIRTDVATRGGMGTVNWTVAAPATAHGLVRVAALGAVAAADVNNAFLEVSDPFLRITTITAAQDWGIGTERRIGWSHNLGTAGRVHVDVTRDDGATWSRVAADVPLRGTESAAYHWRVAGPPSQRVRLRIQRTTDPSVSSISPRFSVSAPMVRLEWPTAGATVHGCSQFTPQWRHNLGTLEAVLLQWSLDGGRTWVTRDRIHNPRAVRGSYIDYEFVAPATDAAAFRVVWERNASVQGVSGSLRITAVPDYPYCD
jgi:Tol biopolymer transport system component